MDSSGLASPHHASDAGDDDDINNALSHLPFFSSSSSSSPAWPLTQVDVDLQVLNNMETAIRWAPTSTVDDARFLYVDIKGQKFQHCKVTSRPEKSTLTFDVLAEYANAADFRSFDWSPTEENLVAVGHASGEVCVVRLDDGVRTPLALPSSKGQRACHGLAWNTRGLLAAGLDKFRGDHCLNVWDCNQLPLRAGAVPDPLFKYANGEPVTSVKFFSDQPSVLIAGMKGQSMRLYDLREGPGNSSLQFSTRCVHTIAVDPLDENYFASCAPIDNASICIWDRRVGSRYATAAGGSVGAIDSGHVLEVKPDIDAGSAIWSLQFSPNQRGRLGMLTDAGVFRAYHIVKEYSSEEHQMTLEKTIGRESSKHYPEQLYTKTVRDFQTGTPPRTRSEDPSKRVAAFDFLNLGCGIAGELGAITIMNDKSVALYTLPPVRGPIALSPKVVFARGGFGNGQHVRFIEPLSKFKAAQAIEEVRKHIAAPKTKSKNESKKGKGKALPEPEEDLSEFASLSSRERRERLVLPEKVACVQDALTMLSLQQLRCKDGYMLDPERNQKIVADDPMLQDLWGWIGRARARASNETMIIHKTDLNYLGVQSIWSGNLGLSLENRLASSDLDDDVDVTRLIEELVKKLGLADTKMCQTDFPAQRKLCLQLCGALQSVSDLEKMVNQLVQERQHTKAAALAAFYDKRKMAHSVLRKNQPTQAHKTLAMAVAGSSQAKAKPDWEETCADIAKEFTDPFARAILALAGNGGWESVLQETTLPLKYRVEVALRWLPDDQLTTYIRNTTLEAVRQGDIEGILLTGLDHGAMDLFESYIRKFDDYQTAVLVMTYTVPRFVSDPLNAARFEKWRQTYRRQINMWKLHVFRARFDVEARKLGVTWDGRKLIKPPPQQVSLVCTYCTRPIIQKKERQERQETQVSGGETVHYTQGHPLGGSSQMLGTACPKCGRQMPRCGVCSMWLGAPDPMSKAATAEDAKKDAGGATKDKDGNLKRFVTFCIKCNHGFHAHHAKEWFARHNWCPADDCNCVCEA